MQVMIEAMSFGDPVRSFTQLDVSGTGEQWSCSSRRLSTNLLRAAREELKVALSVIINA
jgi:hypothetical protein